MDSSNQPEKVIALDVYSDTTLVGVLARDDSGELSFSYDVHWVSDLSSIPLSPSMPLTMDRFQGLVVRSFFENLLPEGGIREFVARASHLSPENIVGLLGVIGADTAGLFSMMPHGYPVSHDHRYLPVTMDDLRSWIQNTRGIPLGGKGSGARMSLSGAQDKITVFIDQAGQYFLPLGLSPSTHIIKPSVNHRDDAPNTAINESLVMKLAQKVLKEVPDAEYLPELDAAVIRRYDREYDEDGRIVRIHQNDLCQIIGVVSDLKYESEGGPSLKDCFDAVMENSSQPVADKKRMIEWVIFNVITGNMDSHAKNLSMIHSDEGLRLAPFYDLVCTSIYPNLSQKFAFKIGGENRPEWMMARHWERFATDCGISMGFMKKTMQDVLGKTMGALPVVLEEIIGQVGDTEKQEIAQKVAALVETQVSKIESRVFPGCRVVVEIPGSKLDHGRDQPKTPIDRLE